MQVACAIFGFQVEIGSVRGEGGLLRNFCGNEMLNAI